MLLRDAKSLGETVHRWRLPARPPGLLVHWQQCDVLRGWERSEQSFAAARHGFEGRV